MIVTSTTSTFCWDELMAISTGQMEGRSWLLLVDNFHHHQEEELLQG